MLMPYLHFLFARWLCGAISYERIRDFTKIGCTAAAVFLHDALSDTVIP
jgi:hypothetical protein